MAAELLQSIGLTAATPTNPKSFEDQKLITQQTATVRSQLRSILSSVDFAVQAAALAGLPTSGLEALQKDIAATVTSVTLSPADLEKKRAEYEASFDKVRSDQEKLIRAEQQKTLEATVDAIRKRVGEVTAEEKATEAIKARFRDLLEKAEYSLKIMKAPVPAADAPAPEPAPMSNEDLQNQLAILNIDKEKEEDAVFSWARFFKRIFYQTRTYFWYAFLVIGALLGGILCSNLYVLERFWAMRLYYFAYGAAFFPLVMAYSLFRPPYIYSTLFPFSEREQKDVLSVTESLFSFERLDPMAAEQKLGHTKSYARIFVAGYGLAYAAYFFVYYGVEAAWTKLKGAIGSA